jgi:hypothetical protein
MSVAAQSRVLNTLPASHTEAFHRWETSMQAAETRMILVVGADARLMEWAALSLFRAGHIPVLGQWFWPLVTSDSASVDGAFDDLADPVGARLLGRCDAVLCVDAPTPGANALVTTARARGMRVYDNLEDAIAG